MKKASSRAKAAARRAAPRGVVREEMRAEYDFSGGVRGKYAGRFGRGGVVRVVVLAPDVAEAFGSARAAASGRRSRRTA